MAADRAQNLQDTFLNHVRKQKVPLTIFLVGTRVWALGKKHGFMTPVQMFRDRWECSHIGTVIFAGS